MGLKILHTADWHLDAAFSSFSQEQRQLLRRAQLALPGKIADLCREEKCDVLLIAGDVFDGKPGREAVEAVKRALEDCGVPVFISPGNHDFVEMDSPWRQEQWPQNVTVFMGDLESVALPQLDLRIYGAGYRSMDCAPLLENFRAAGTEKYHIAVLHGDPVTSNSPYCCISASQVRDSGLHYLALGHIHKAGMFRRGSTLCAWPGCPMGRGWDETGEKGVCITELDEHADARMIPMDAPRFFELETEEDTLDHLLPAAGCDDFYRITLTGSSAVDLQSLQNRYAEFPNLFLRDRRQTEEDLWADAGEDTFRGVYFRMLQQLSGEDPRAVLAAEISRKILSEREVELP